MQMNHTCEILGMENGGGAAKPKNTKRLSVERIYQKKTQLEHILLRPDTYIGSVEKQTQVNETSLLQIYNHEVAYIHYQ